jgi:transposase
MLTRLSPGIRGLFRKFVKKGLSVKRIAQLFDTTRETVYRWLKRGNRPGRESFKGRPREPKESKVTVDVEVSILALRTSFGWGTARIQQGLFKLPSYVIGSVPNLVQGIWLSRKTVNNVLTKHGLNGYPNNYHRWKFFRAKSPDILWQIDLKGPFTVHGKKYWLLVCIDDYSRFLVIAEQFDHAPTTREITALIERQERRPEGILSDHGPQFREEWKGWCKWHGIVAHYAHPSYPQDKGKVGRCIQNMNREFVHNLMKFPEWLSGSIKEYKEWFNHSRFHRGVNAMPAELYECHVGNFT